MIRIWELFAKGQKNVRYCDFKGIMQGFVLALLRKCSKKPCFRRVLNGHFQAIYLKVSRIGRFHPGQVRLVVVVVSTISILTWHPCR